MRLRDAQYVLIGPVFNSSQAEFLKWIAIIAMTIGHVSFSLHTDTMLYYYISRIAFPIFAFLVVYNYIHHTSNSLHYLIRILIVAVLAEAPYQYLFHPTPYMSNILFTIGLGLAAVIAIDYLMEYKDKEGMDIRRLWAGWYGVFLSVFVLGFFVDYIHLGVFLIIAYWGWLRFPSYSTFFAAFIFTFILDFPAGATSAYFAVLFFGVLVVAAWFSFKIPRVNKWFFYAYYPIHLIFLSAV